MATTASCLTTERKNREDYMWTAFARTDRTGLYLIGQEQSKQEAIELIKENVKNESDHERIVQIDEFCYVCLYVLPKPVPELFPTEEDKKEMHKLKDAHERNLATPRIP